MTGGNGTDEENEVSSWIRWFQYSYFLRFTLLGIVVLLGMPYVATRIAPSMLAGMLVLEEPLEIVAVTFLAYQMAWILMISYRLTMLYGPERFGVTTPFALAPKLSVRDLLLWAVVPIPLLAYVYMRSVVSVQGKVVASICGALASLVLLFVSALVQHILLSPDAEVPDLLFPRIEVLKQASAVNLKLGFWRRFTSKCFEMIPESLGRGYVDYENARLHSGQALAIAFLVIQTTIYMAGYFLLNPAYSSHSGTVPALAYILILLITLTMIFTALAFLLDPYRVPVILCSLLFVCVVYATFDSEHYYQIEKREFPPIQPNATVDSWKNRNPDNNVFVVVAANGGGIQAAAWTTTVLTGLQAVCKTKFSDSIALLSSVSGGSLGTILFVNEYSSGGFPTDPHSLKEIVARSERSSLNEMAWGMIYPDTLRVLAPFFVSPKTIDRGWAMEQAWRKNWTGEGDTLYNWNQDLANNIKPAVILNATLAESGERFLLSNFSIPNQWGNKSFSNVYPDHDLLLSTAARLSSTFPYVTPMARPIAPQETLAAFHVADGGYYDNFGVATVLDYLKEILPYFRKRYHGKKVIVVQIRSAPSERIPSPKTKWGAVEQATGPLRTLLSVRTSAQIFRNDNEIEMVAADWKASGGELIAPVFQFTEANPPLSWRLTPTQKFQLEFNWQRWQYQQIGQIKQFLACP